MTKFKVGDKVTWFPARSKKDKGKISNIDGEYITVMVKIGGKKYPFEFYPVELQLKKRKNAK